MFKAQQTKLYAKDLLGAPVVRVGYIIRGQQQVQFPNNTTYLKASTLHAFACGFGAYPPAAQSS